MAQIVHPDIDNIMREMQEYNKQHDIAYMEAQLAETEIEETSLVE